jgi:flagellar motor component MotA
MPTFAKLMNARRYANAQFMKSQGYKKLNTIILILSTSFWVAAIIGLIQALTNLENPNYIGYLILLSFLRIIIQLVSDYRNQSIKKER